MKINKQPDNDEHEKNSIIYTGLRFRTNVTIALFVILPIIVVIIKCSDDNYTTTVSGQSVEQKNNADSIKIKDTTN